MKYISKLQEFLESELSDYSYFSYEIKFDEENQDYEYYNVEINTLDKTKKQLIFRVFKESLAVQMYDDGDYQITASHNFTAKYFWMALLSWDI